MDIRAIFLAVSALASLISCSGCGPFAECFGGAEHTFQEEVLFSPEKLQYHVGDTIWISTKFSCQNLLNLNTGSPEDYCGLESIGSSIQILLLEPSPNDSLAAIAAVNNFYFVSIEGTTSPFNEKTRGINFQIKEEEYSFKFGVIPKIMGNYSAFISDSAPTKLNGNDRCDTGVFGLINVNKENHIQLLENFNRQPVSDFVKTHVYCFEVIE